MIIGFISSVITTRQFMKYCSAVNCCCAAVFDEDKNWKLFENSELKIIWLWWCCNYDHPVIASHSQHSVFRKIWLKLFSPNNFKTYSSYFQEYSFIDGFVGSDYIYIHFSKYFSKLKIVLPLFDCWDQCETCDLCWLTPTRATSWLAVTITVCSGPSLWPSLAPVQCCAAWSTSPTQCCLVTRAECHMGRSGGDQDHTRSTSVLHNSMLVA